MTGPGAGFGAGFLEGLSGSMARNKDEKLRQEERQQKNAQQGLSFLLESGQVGDIADIPEPLLGAAFPGLFGEEAVKARGKGKAGQVDPSAIIKTILGHAIQVGRPMLPGPAAEGTAPQTGAPPVDSTGTPMAGPMPAPLESQPFAMPGQTQRRTVGGVPILSPQEAAQRKVSTQLSGEEALTMGKIAMVRNRLLPAMRQLDPTTTLEDAMLAAGLKVQRDVIPSFSEIPGEVTDADGTVRQVSGILNRHTGEITDPISHQPIPGFRHRAFSTGAAGGLGSVQDYMKTYAKEHNIALGDMTTEDKRNAMREAVSAKSVAGLTEDAKVARAKEVAAGIRSGEQPPELTRLGGLAGYVRAELKKENYDLTRATQDWMATQRHLATLNSPQQLRLRQAVEFVVESVPLVQSLSEDLDKLLDKTRYPLLNRGIMLMAKNGVGVSDEAKNAAQNLDNQITEMRTELATMFRGGNVATNEALQRADTLLQSNWDTKQLKTALDLIEKNAQIRLNSIANTGPAGTTPGNRYQPTGGKGGSATEKGGSTPIPGFTMKDGKLHFNGQPIEK